MTERDTGVPMIGMPVPENSPIPEPAPASQADGEYFSGPLQPPQPEYNGSELADHLERWQPEQLRTHLIVDHQLAVVSDADFITILQSHYDRHMIADGTDGDHDHSIPFDRPPVVVRDPDPEVVQAHLNEPRWDTSLLRGHLEHMHDAELDHAERSMPTLRDMHARRHAPGQQTHTLDLVMPESMTVDPYAGDLGPESVHDYSMPHDMRFPTDDFINHCPPYCPARRPSVFEKLQQTAMEPPPDTSPDTSWVGFVDYRGRSIPPPPPLIQGPPTRAELDAAALDVTIRAHDHEIWYVYRGRAVRLDDQLRIPDGTLGGRDLDGRELAIVGALIDGIARQIERRTT